jgi:hypothetical protein
LFHFSFFHVKDEYGDPYGGGGGYGDPYGGMGGYGGYGGGMGGYGGYGGEDYGYGADTTPPFTLLEDVESVTKVRLLLSYLVFSVSLTFCLLFL